MRGRTRAGTCTRLMGSFKYGQREPIHGTARAATWRCMLLSRPGRGRIINAMQGSMSARTYNLWLLLRPAEDVPGQWIAHCLDLDVVTQGNSISHAFTMAQEAVCMVVAEDMSEGRDPLERRAPDEFWAELWPVVTRGTVVPLSQLKGEGKDAALFCAAQIVVHAWSEKRMHDCPVEMPAIWTAGRRGSGEMAARV